MRGLGGLAILAAFAVLVPGASASIEVRDSETTALLHEIDKAKCREKKGKNPFVAFSLPANDLYTLSLYVQKSAWTGFGGTYDIFYGSGPVDIDVFGPGPGERYSNEFGIPGTPPGTVGAGGIKLSNNGKRLSIGVFALNDEAFSKGVSLSGAARCSYKNR